MASESDIHKELSILRKDIRSLKAEILKLFQTESVRKTKRRKKLVKLKGALKGVKISDKDASKAKRIAKHTGA